MTVTLIIIGGEDDDSSDSRPPAEVGKKRKAEVSPGDQVSSKKSSAGQSIAAVTAESTIKRPDNFSRVTSNLSAREMVTRFPKYIEACKSAVTVTLDADDLLYIPTGWFHEVQSIGSGGHIAFNYWFHPPDQWDFYNPYSSSFWKDVYADKLSFVK